ncbi:MAG: putative bifunctional diguanylate cyclase/phosphodiesterase [Vulcanococcus sp.]
MTTPPDPERQRLERENKRLRHELDEAVRALPHLRQMVQFSGDLLILASAGGRILEANARLAEVLGVELHTLYGQPLRRWLPHPGQSQLLEERLAIGAAPEPLRMEIELQPERGEALTMELEAQPLEHCPDPSAIAQPRWTLSLRDIGLRRRLASSEAARQVQSALIASLRSSEARYQGLVEQLSDGLAQVDAGGTLLFANPALHRILGVRPGELLGRRITEFLPELALATFQQIWGAVLARQDRRCTLTLRADDSTLRQVALEFQAVRAEAAERARGTAASLLVRDVTKLNQALDELTNLAFRDSLTGLANAEASRRDLERRLNQAALRPWMVLWLDLDGFRRVNHTLGRGAGDALLMAVADGLRDWASSSDLLARLGGDEFLLVRQLSAEPEAAEDLQAEAEAVVQQLRSRLNRLETGLEASPLGLAFSAGYSLAPLHGRNAEDLLQAAATALSRAREVAPGTALVYEPTFTSRLRREMALEGQLHQALHGGGLRLVFQPQMDASGHLLGAEALLRWYDPVLGHVPPTRFVPLAERSGLIHRLGQWVLEQVCRQLRCWLDAGLNPPRLAVNLSPRQFELTVPSLLQQVGHLLELYRLPAELLELEITESCIVPMAGVVGQVQQLGAMGVQVALDDFGTGYSSLAMLHRLAIHKLKIDRSFVDRLERNESARTIVRTALAMGRALGLETLAEGVETAGQLEVLEALGCDAYQGFWFSRPLELEAFTALLPPRRSSDEDGGSVATGDVP